MRLENKVNNGFEGIHRIRPPKGKPKEVTVLCNVPLDLEVDDLFSWKDFVSGGSRIEKMI